MREIKFRALVEYEGLGRVWEHYKPFSQPMWIEPNVAKIIVKDLQFTGLKDDDGIKIYEGDIIVDISNNRLAVEWNDDTCCFQFSDGSQINNGDRYATYKKIIGNLYENPELLKQ